MSEQLDDWEYQKQGCGTYQVKDKYAIFTGYGGYNEEKKEVSKILVVGQKYDVIAVQVNDWSTYFTLKDFPAQKFNSALFYNEE